MPYTRITRAIILKQKEILNKRLRGDLTRSQVYHFRSGIVTGSLYIEKIPARLAGAIQPSKTSLTGYTTYSDITLFHFIMDRC